MAHKQLIRDILSLPPNLRRIIAEYASLTDEDRISMLFDDNRNRIAVKLSPWHTVHISRCRVSQLFYIGGDTVRGSRLQSSELLRPDAKFMLPWMQSGRDMYARKMRELLDRYNL